MHYHHSFIYLFIMLHIFCNPKSFYVFWVWGRAYKIIFPFLGLAYKIYYNNFKTFFLRPFQVCCDKGLSTFGTWMTKLGTVRPELSKPRKWKGNPKKKKKNKSAGSQSVILAIPKTLIKVSATPLYIPTALITAEAEVFQSLLLNKP